MTDEELINLIEYLDLQVKERREIIANMDKWVKDLHSALKAARINGAADAYLELSQMLQTMRKK